MEKSYKISDSEWEVMKIIWDDQPKSSSEIIKVLKASKGWKPTTIKTLIKRLVDKEIISYTVSGKSYYYYPVVDKKECMHANNKMFINKFYNGALKSMLASFVEMNELSEKDIDELKQILENKKK
jgi:BlaI family penicillinase repressor